MTDAYEVTAVLDDRWFALPVGPSSYADADADAGADGDLDAWAVSAVDRALALRGIEETPGRRRVWQQMYAAEVGLVTDEVDEDCELVAAYLLVPAADVVPVTTVVLQVVRVGPAGVEGAVASAVAPEGERDGAPEIEEIDTSAGACVRVRQVLLADEVGLLRSAVAYVWDLPEPDLVLVASAVFGSPSDAAEHGKAVDDLAVSLGLARGEPSRPPAEPVPLSRPAPARTGWLDRLRGASRPAGRGRR